MAVSATPPPDHKELYMSKGRSDGRYLEKQRDLQNHDGGVPGVERQRDIHHEDGGVPGRWREGD